MPETPQHGSSEVIRDAAVNDCIRQIPEISGKPHGREASVFELKGVRRRAQNGTPTREIEHHRLGLNRIHQNRY